MACSPGARAQCNTSTNPPPAPPVITDFANQSFSHTAPSQPIPPLTSIGAIGCDGPEAGNSDVDGNPGLPGLPGQAGGQIGSTSTDLTIRGGHFVIGNDTYGACIATYGGKGGNGSEAGAPSLHDTTSGAGGTGGAGEAAVVQFGVNFAPDVATGPANIGLGVASFGTAGGSGDHSDNFGGNIHYGGAGGVVTLTAGGALVALDTGVSVLFLGGQGGKGDDATSSDPLFARHRGRQGQAVLAARSR